MTTASLALANFRKTDQVVVSVREQAAERQIEAKIKVAKFNWFWWHHHFRTAQYSSQFAKECWIKRVNELGQTCSSYKIDGERIMEVKKASTVSLTNGRSDKKTDQQQLAIQDGSIKLSASFLHDGETEAWHTQQC